MSSPVTTAAPFRAIEAGDVLELGFLAKYFRISNILVTKGDILVPNITPGASAFLIKPVVSAISSQFYVAIETVDNSAGSAGDLSIGVASDGDLVALKSGSIMVAGDTVGIDASVVTEVITIDPDVAASLNLKVGTYEGKEAATFDRDTSTPFTETLNGSRIFPDNAADGDIVGIRLGK